MTNLPINIISTGSHGNCVIINNELMIDCGVSKKMILDNVDPSNIKLMLITHHHLWPLKQSNC